MSQDQAQDPQQLQQLLGLEVSLTPKISTMLCHLAGLQLCVVTVHHLRLGAVQMLFPLDGLRELISVLETTLAIAQDQSQLVAAPPPQGPKH
jgi:hypothetical protein